MDKHIKRQQGIISFMAVMFISMLLIVITTSFIRIMINEQRQSIDFDQSAKAFFAAEAGVEDAVAKINAGDPVDDTCNNNVTFADASGSGATAVTCQQVNTDYKATARDILYPGETVDLNLRFAESFDEVRIYWSKEIVDIASDGPDTNQGENLAPDEWDSRNIPPALRSVVVSYPDPARFSSSDLKLRTVIGWPQLRGFAGLGAIALPGGVRSLNTADATCAENNKNDSDIQNYRCILRITDFENNYDHVMQIKSFNSSRATDYKVAVFKNGSQVTINRDVKQIDVTARVSDVYRRIVATYNPTGEDVNRHHFGRDYVIYGDEEVCKQLYIERNPSGSPRRANTETPSCNP